MSASVSSLAHRVAALLLAAALVAAPARTITIATYNVENYVATGRLVDGVYRPDYPKPEAEKAALRRVIAALNADILALQEMGPRPYLDELQRDLKVEGVDLPHAALLEAADPERHVALLSRLPWREIRPHPDVPLAGGDGGRVKRGLLEVAFGPPATGFTLFIVHLKSQLAERVEDPAAAHQRLLEARAVRDAVLDRFPEPATARFVVCGDWNDGSGSAPVRTLQRRGPVRLGQVLPAFDTRGEGWTHHYAREDSYSRLDYFLVSPGLGPANARASVFDGPDTLEASDHRPVVLRLELPWREASAGPAPRSRGSSGS